MAERSAINHEGLLFRGDIILDDRAHGTGAGSRVDDGPPAGAMNQVEEHSFRLLVNLRERVGPHIHKRLGADGGYLGIDVAGKDVGLHFSLFPI